MEKYIEIADAENQKETIITELKKPLEIKPIPRDLN